jgi:hypothetical protein
MFLLAGIDIFITLASNPARLKRLLIFQLIAEYPEALPFIDGLAVHYYFDRITPPSILNAISRRFPDKIILATEASEG